MSALLPLPIVLPLATAGACLLLRDRLAAQRAVSVAGSGALLVAAVALLAATLERGVIVTFVGRWPAPYGITLVSDLLAAIMVLLAAITGTAVLVYALGSVDRGREHAGFHPLFHVLLMGVCGAFLTGDLFNLYVWFEVLLMASFVLLALGGERPQLEGAIKYVTLNLISSALFLAAVGTLYGVAGTLNMADLSLAISRGSAGNLTTTLATLLLVAFGIKAAVFPLFFWLPASYHTPPVAVAAVFSGLLTKVGVYALVRAFTLVFVGEPELTHRLILACAALTMLTGVLGAMSQMEVRRLLSFHIVSQIGYMVLGLGLLSPLALAGTVFYLVHHIIVKTNLFLITGALRHARGSFDLREMGGLWASRPLLGLLFFIPALSLAGLPPLSGFWGKLVLVRAGLEQGEWLVTGVALFVSLLTLYSMLKIWNEAFWKPAAGTAAATPPIPRLVVAPIVALAAITVAIGLAAGPVFEIAQRAGEQLAQPSAYVGAVLGPEAVR